MRPRLQDAEEPGWRDKIRCPVEASSLKLEEPRAAGPCKALPSDRMVLRDQRH
jgi:hypothetical protein